MEMENVDIRMTEEMMIVKTDYYVLSFGKEKL